MYSKPLTLEQTARSIGRTADYFYRNWRRLVEAESFPKPIQNTPPYHWHPAAVEAWKLRDAPAALAAYVDQLQVQADGNMDAWRAELKRRLERERA